MLKPFNLYFKVKKLRNYKEALRVFKDNKDISFYDRDKQRIDQYSMQFFSKLVSSTGGMLLENYKSDLAEIIEKSGKEILEKKAEIEQRDKELKNQNFNKIQEDLYSTKEAKVEFNENNKIRNDYIKQYNNARQGLKTLIIDKLSNGLYEQVDLDEAADAIIDGNGKYFEEHPEIIDSIDPIDFADIFGDIISNEYVESIVDEIPQPKNISYELYKYAVTGIKDEGIINGIVSETKLSEIEFDYKNLNDMDKDSIEDKETLDDIDFLEKQINEIKEVENNFNLNGQRLKAALGELTPADGSKYTDRLELIIACYACDGEISYDDDRELTENDKRLNTPLGMDSGLYNDFDAIGKYVLELINHSDAFGSQSATYTEGIDFAKVVADSKAKYENKLSREDARKTFTETLEQGMNIQADSKAIYEMLNRDGINNAPANFKKIVDKCLDGKSGLKAFNNRVKMDRNMENIAKVIDYITTLYNKEFNELSSDILVNNRGEAQEAHSQFALGLSSEFIRKMANSLFDPEAYSLLKFNTQLNLYTLPNEELYILNDPNRPNDEKEFLKASVKTSGLRVDKDSSLLNDALSTYGRLKEIHENRGSFYWLFHPIKNYRERNYLSTMKETLQKMYDFTDRELEVRVSEVLDNSTDPINKVSYKILNPNKYNQISQTEVDNQNSRDKIIQDMLDNIEKYGTIQAPKKLEEGQEILKSRIVKDGIVVDDIQIDKNSYDMSLDDFILHLDNENNLTRAILADKDLSEEEIEKRVKEESLEKIQKYVDPEGYQKDKNQETSELISDIEQLKENLENNSKESQEKLEYSKKLKEIHKEIRKLKAEARIDKFNTMVLESQEKDELLDIEKAENEQDKAKAQEIYDKNQKLREQNAKEKEEREALRNKTLKELDDKIRQLNVNKEVTELNEAFDSQFNSIDDSLRANNASPSETKTLNTLNQKFDLNLEEDTNVEKSEDDFNVGLEEEIGGEKELNP